MTQNQYTCRDSKYTQKTKERRFYFVLCPKSQRRLQHEAKIRPQR